MAGRILPAVRPQKPAPQPPAPAVAPARVPNVLSWRTGDRVRWQRYTGTFLRETVDGQAEATDRGQDVPCTGRRAAAGVRRARCHAEVVDAPRRQER